MTKKSAIMCAIIIGLMAVGAAGAIPVAAEDLENYPRIVQKIADRFGLDEDEVQKVFVEFHEEHKAEMRENLHDKLNDLVASGKITAQQRQAILEKFEEMKEDLKDLEGLSPEERKAKLKEHLKEKKTSQQDLKTWAAENNIDLNLLPKMHFRHGKMHKHWH